MMRDGDASAKVPLLTREDAAFVEKVLDIDLSDEHRFAAFAAAGSIDVQAAPGSGKTTLLAAKLVALGRKWAKGGICVLSHTNVAHREISDRVLASGQAEHLLRPPHFVGTFQAFAHTFLAFPALRALGITAPRVDDEHFEMIAARVCQEDQFAVAFNYWRQKQHAGGPAWWFGKLEYLDADLTIGIEGRPMPFGDSTTTYKQMRTFKRVLSKFGVYRYRDMFALALWRLRKFPELSHKLTLRFPIVIIDEVQDTEEYQAELISTIFGEGAVVQRVGDVNQGIFSGGGTKSPTFGFPGKGAICVSNSRRFGVKIASIASRLAHEYPMQIEGLVSRPSPAPLLILFDATRISRVLSVYAQYVLDELPGDVANPVVKAVGFRVRPTGSEPRPVPSMVGDYWPKAAATLPAVPGRLPLLPDYISAAHDAFTDGGHSGVAFALVRQGVERALSEAWMRHIGAAPPRNRGAWERELRAAAPGQWHEFRLAARSGLTDPVLDDTSLVKLAEALLVPFAPILGEAALHAALGTLNEWKSPAVRPPEVSRRSSVRHPFPYVAPDGRRLTIEVSSIHAVKGETHDATLLLETYHNGHDVEAVVPWIAGTTKKGAKVGVRLADRLRLAFVALTRPRYLAGIAAREDHVSEVDRAALAAEGWRIVVA